jgi:predicted ester cyclase
MTVAEGVEDFIARVTYAIWNQPDPDPELVRRYYGPDTVIHADAGDLAGADAVVASTRERLQAFPDFHGVIDETIWTDDEHGVRTSMRWTWTGTHSSGRRVELMAIANCRLDGERFAEEWLATDHLDRLRQLGADVDVTAPPAPVPPAPSWTSRIAGPGALVAEHLTATEGSGVRIDDQYWRRAGGLDRVATQWTLDDTLRISHHHVRDGRIVGVWTACDRLALERRRHAAAEGA